MHKSCSMKLSAVLCLQVKLTSLDMRKIVCVILGLGTISWAFSTQAPVQYVPLGNKVTIPCDGYGDRSAGNWLHRDDDHEFTSIVHEMSGLTFKSKHLSTRRKTIRNFSLEISPFTELDKGTYVCRVCRLERCTGGKPITLLPQFGMFYTALDGDLFSYSCLYNLTQKADWRFEALGENNASSLNSKFTDKNVLIISDVHPNNAGIYSYWIETYTGQQQRVCSVNLCVLLVNAEKLTDSPQNCTLYCDVDVHKNEEGLAVVETEKWNISIIGSTNKPKSSLRCRLLSSVVETHTLNLENPTATAQSYATSSITADNSRHPPVAALICMCIGFLFIVVIVVFILLYVLRQRADRNSSRSTNGHTEGETDFKVIYSTVKVGRCKQQNAITSDTECVYSQIVVTKNI